MVQYICMYCAAVGGSGNEHHKSPPSYHCHVCKQKDAMFPTKVVKRLQHVIAEKQALAAHQADLVRELTACQSVLHQLARAGEVTPQYADDAKAVLERTKETSLARLKAEWQTEALVEGLRRMQGTCYGEFRIEDYIEELRRQAEEGES